MLQCHSVETGETSKILVLDEQYELTSSAYLASHFDGSQIYNVIAQVIRHEVSNDWEVLAAAASCWNGI